MCDHWYMESLSGNNSFATLTLAPSTRSFGTAAATAAGTGTAGERQDGGSAVSEALKEDVRAIGLC